ELADALRLLPPLGFIGVNLTIPHKAAALSLMDRLDDHARRIGVVNTVVVEGGRLAGFNTDGPGLVRAVRGEFGSNLSDLRVMILGAGGGAGRAIAMQCAIENCPRLVLVNRTLDKIESLKTELTPLFRSSGAAGRDHVSTIPWDETSLREAVREIDLVINSTSVGLASGDPSPLPASMLESRLLVYDTIYTANRTKLMLAADEVGARSANGLSMLLHQGALSFEIWFHREAPVEEMREALLNQARKRK
ncbi:MAG TPA: shikimate dehydrogenase, partial [Chthoniobacteraceae bacterium]